jgi:hypothetical protein
MEWAVHVESFREMNSAYRNCERKIPLERPHRWQHIIKTGPKETEYGHAYWSVLVQDTDPSGGFVNTVMNFRDP